ncbi:MAG: hypothetical protein WEE64_00795 [Dehalococcoidia bacterium]
MVDSTRTTRTAAVGGLLALAALVVSLGFLLGNAGSASAQSEGGAMTADCEGATVAIEDDCDFGGSQAFTVAIHVPEAPDGGYWGFQAKLRWNGDVIDYQPSAAPLDEAVWSDCSVPARTDNRASQAEVDSSVLYGCVPFPLPEPTGPGIDYTGAVYLFSFVCQAEGSSDLTLVPREDDVQLGSHFIDANLAPVDPSLTNASVTCGGADVDRPDPEIIAGNVTPLPPEGTPQPQGPTNTPGGPTATPGGPTSTLAPTPPPQAEGPTDDDDGGLPVWAWVVIGVGAVAGVGGGGFLLWRRMNSGGAGGAGPAGGSTPSDSGGSGSGSDAPSSSAGDG